MNYSRAWLVIMCEIGQTNSQENCKQKIDSLMSSHWLKFYHDTMIALLIYSPLQLNLKNHNLLKPINPNQIIVGQCQCFPNLWIKALYSICLCNVSQICLIEIILLGELMYLGEISVLGTLMKQPPVALITCITYLYPLGILYTSFGEFKHGIWAI